MEECFLDFIFFIIRVRPFVFLVGRVRPFVFLVGRATVFSNSLKLEKKIRQCEGIYFLKP